LWWSRFSDTLRRAPALARDVDALVALGVQPLGAASSAAAAYAARICEAAAMEAGGAPPLLLGHAYTRYLADLFGGSMIGWPTALALGLRETPAFYVHAPEIGLRRAAFVESVYEALNDAGEGLDAVATRAVVDEAALAFRLNAALYREGPGGGGVGMFAGAAVGGARVLLGHAADRARGGRRDLFGKERQA